MVAYLEVVCWSACPRPLSQGPSRRADDAARGRRGLSCLANEGEGGRASGG